MVILYIKVDGEELYDIFQIEGATCLVKCQLIGIEAAEYGIIEFYCYNQ
ncbi:hypothetical protein [Syntrophomonas wolfei]|nr:hypothetical protein [Syntrophomonas wolfei]